MAYVNLLIKPASSLCNMRCRYCFYADESEHRMEKSMGVMSAETAGALLDAAFAAAGGKGAVSFAFQGGEPTMAGLGFFRTFAGLAGEKNIHHLPVSWGIQTNGLNLDDDWIAFFREQRFLVGISVDGTPSLHDAFRPDVHGQGTWDRVADRVTRLLNAGVDTNLLCVVNGQTTKSPKKVYRSLKQLNTGFLQFIPCLDPLGVPRGSMAWSLTPDAYGSFLCEVFDEWFADWQHGRYVSVRQFDDWVHAAMGMPPGTCASCGQCGSYLVAEADGSLYPCDFYVLDEWRLGTPADGLRSLMRCEQMKAFQRRSAEKPDACRACRYWPLCRGGCPRDWEDQLGGRINYFCPSFRTFFRYAEERIRYIAAVEQQAMKSMRR